MNFETFAYPSDLYTQSPTDYPGRTDNKLRMKPRLRKKAGEPDISSTGQAGNSDVLVDQQGNLVYYSAYVNEVYYNFVKDNGFNLVSNINAADPALDFPTDGAGSIELKMSWRIAAMGTDVFIENTNDFITIQAEVDKYEFTGGKWVNQGAQQALMAMVGFHVVGTVPNHPEFIWATFEQRDNDPICAATTGGKLGPTNPATGNPWSFYPGDFDCEGNTNCNHGSTIDKDDGLPNSVCLVVPDGAGSPENIANINTLNASVAKQLPAGDVRRNYFYGGGIWTNNGELPATMANERGSLKLANTTAETYFQDELNCFSCHNSSNPPSKALSGEKNIYLSHLLGLAVDDTAAATAK